MSEAAVRTTPAPLTVRALERALRRRILSWGPDRPRDPLARLREDVEQALRGVRPTQPLPVEYPAPP